MFARSRTAAPDAPFLGPAEWCKNSLQAFSGDLSSLWSHHRVTMSTVLQALVQDMPLEGGLLGEGGRACGKGV